MADHAARLLGSSGRISFLVLLLAALWSLESLAPLGPARVRPRARAANLALWAMVVAVNLALASAAAGLLDWAAAGGIGLARLVPLPAWTVIAIGVVGLDLASYLVHVAFHRTPAFWRIH